MGNTLRYYGNIGSISYSAVDLFYELIAEKVLQIPRFFGQFIEFQLLTCCQQLKHEVFIWIKLSYFRDGVIAIECQLRVDATPVFLKGFAIYGERPILTFR
ncbi:hypothetical protein WT23_10520 [Burkholderia territorii]|nr:hypothetical protein WT23_10520 [Burkholderia territorii]